MLFIIALLALWVKMALGQSPCATPPASSTFDQVVMRYTPYMTPQIAPTSTIYETILTSWFNALDCRYLTPLRVDENPAAEGPFTTYVRSSILTITRVGCMPETTAVTRRDYRGQEQLEVPTATVHLERQVHKRGTAQDAIEEAANDMPNTIPSNLTDLTVQAYRYLVSVNTAIFAINLIQLAVPLNQTCTQLRDPVTQARLFTTTIDPIQAGDIICFAANNGLYFEEPIPAVITYLEDVFYAIQARSSYSSESTAFCWPLEPLNSPWLGFDLQGIAQYLCPNATSIVSSTATGEATGTVLSTSTAGVSTISVGTASASPTGGPYANSTAVGGTGGPGYGVNSTTVGATATQGPYANSTAESSAVSTIEPTDTIGGTIGTVGITSSYGTGITFTNVTYATAGTGTAIGIGLLPPVTTAVSPAIEPATTAPTRQFRRWYRI